MPVFLVLFVVHVLFTGTGLALHRRLFTGRSFRFPHTLAQALHAPSFWALLLLGIVLPYTVALVTNTLLFHLDYAHGRHTWTLALHTSLSLFFYQIRRRTAARQNPS